MMSQQDPTENKRTGSPKQTPITPNVVPPPPSDDKTEKCRYPGTPWWKTGLEVIAVGAACWYGWVAWNQWGAQINALKVDQRAWVSVPVPSVFPLNGASIPAVTQITNTGKTPARRVEGDVVATVLNKGEEPALGDFSIGHPHNRVYVGAIFPGAPIPITITVVHYGPKMAETIVPDDTLRQDIANGKRFILFYGRITYYDVFGAQHWTQFCTGSGTAILENLRQCISYNDVDTTEE
jgi:hypothetical protein